MNYCYLIVKSQSMCSKQLNLIAMVKSLPRTFSAKASYQGGLKLPSPPQIHSECSSIFVFHSNWEIFWSIRHTCKSASNLKNKEKKTGKEQTNKREKKRKTKERTSKKKKKEIDHFQSKQSLMEVNCPLVCSHHQVINQFYLKILDLWITIRIFLTIKRASLSS